MYQRYNTDYCWTAWYIAITYRRRRKLIDDSDKASCLVRKKMTVSPLEAEKQGVLDRQKEYL